MEEKSLEGWTPSIGPDLTIEQVIDRAFDYRGNVTVVKKDGGQIVGYLFNRNKDSGMPFVQLIDEAGNAPIMLKYAEIANILFSGKDTAAGKSWEAYQRRKGLASPLPLSSTAGEGGTRQAAKP